MKINIPSANLDIEALNLSDEIRKVVEDLAHAHQAPFGTALAGVATVTLAMASDYLLFRPNRFRRTGSTIRPALQFLISPNRTSSNSLVEDLLTGASQGIEMINLERGGRISSWMADAVAKHMMAQVLMSETGAFDPEFGKRSVISSELYNSKRLIRTRKDLQWSSDHMFTPLVLHAKTSRPFSGDASDYGATLAMIDLEEPWLEELMSPLAFVSCVCSERVVDREIAEHTLDTRRTMAALLPHPRSPRSKLILSKHDGWFELLERVLAKVSPLDFECSQRSDVLWHELAKELSVSAPTRITLGEWYAYQTFYSFAVWHALMHNDYRDEARRGIIRLKSWKASATFLRWLHGSQPKIQGLPPMLC